MPTVNRVLQQGHKPSTTPAPSAPTPARTPSPGTPSLAPSATTSTNPKSASVQLSQQGRSLASWETLLEPPSSIPTSPQTSLRAHPSHKTPSPVPASNP